MIIVDSHCHLNMLQERGYSLDEVVSNAKESGIKYMQTISTSMEESDLVISIAEKYDPVFASVGVHPNNVEYVVTHQELIEKAQHPKVIGLGETGLDYYRDQSSEQKQMQRDSFQEHIIASNKTSLPVIIHMRAAEEDTQMIISDAMKNLPFKGLIHCFTSTKEFAKHALDHGLYISISGIVTFKNAADLQEIVKYIPIDRMLVETDSPFLAPVPFRGKTNEPAYTKYVVEFIAELKNMPHNQVANITTENFLTLFNPSSRLVVT